MKAVLAHLDTAAAELSLAPKRSWLLRAITPAAARVIVRLAVVDNLVDPDSEAYVEVPADADWGLRAPFRSIVEAARVDLEPADGALDAVARTHVLRIPISFRLARGVPAELGALVEHLDNPGVDPDAGAGGGRRSRDHDRETPGFVIDRAEIEGTIGGPATVAIDARSQAVVLDAGEIDVRAVRRNRGWVVDLTAHHVAVESPHVEATVAELVSRVDAPDGAPIRIGVERAVLRDLRIPSGAFAGGSLGELQLLSTTGALAPDGRAQSSYDFVITVDPHNDFTIEDLVRAILERARNPELITRITSGLKGAATGSGPVVIESAKWNVFDYVVHRLRTVIAEAAAGVDRPDDPIESRVAHHLRTVTLEPLQRFVQAMHLTTASEVNPHRAQALATVALADPDGNHNKSNIGPEARQAVAALASGHALTAADLRLACDAVRSVGHARSTREREVLRRDWLSGGATWSPDAVVDVVEPWLVAVRARLEADPLLPSAIAARLPLLPDGPALNDAVALGLSTIDAANWVAENVLHDGWPAITASIEAELAARYPDRSGTASFLADGGGPFVDADVRFIDDGVEFFGQLHKLLDDSAAVVAGGGAVALHYWAIEAHAGDESASAVADHLERLAGAGAHVSVVVDEKNGPSRTGHDRLQRAQARLEAARAGAGNDAAGSLTLTRWVPAAGREPVGTHVKYLLTPLGVIAGGSNLGDHYRKWSDTNILLRGPDVVDAFDRIHRDVLADQAANGANVADLPAMTPIPSGAWTPLPAADRGADDWRSVQFRVFRDPGGDLRDRILTEKLAVLETARGRESGRADTVYFCNAYFVLAQPLADNPVARAFNRALRRGVNIELMTNSAASNNLSAVTAPILRSVFLVFEQAWRVHTELGADAGRLTVHLPSTEVMARTYPETDITIHDKALFSSNLAMVSTTNLHPRSFTLEQELLIELIGDDATADAAAQQAEDLAAAERLIRIFGERSGRADVDGLVTALTEPLRATGGHGPALRHPASTLYLQWLKKRLLLCATYDSHNVDDVARLESALITTTQGALADLLIDIF